MFTATNNMHVLIAGNIARTSSASLDPNSANYIADGEVVITNPAGTVLNTTTVATADRVVIVQRSGNQLFKSPVIQSRNVKSYLGSAYTAATEQITFVGYNGSSEALDVINSNDYLMRIIRKDTQATYGNKEMLKFAAYRSDSSATQTEIALGLAASGNKQFSREPEREIVFEAVCNEGVTTANCFDNDATVVNGSNIINVATSLDYNGGAATAVVGDFIRLGSATGAVGATTLTSAVYRITAINSLAITVDRPVHVASGTYTALGNMAEVLTIAEGALANWGVKMLGQARNFTVGVDKYSKVRFDVTLDDFGSSVITKNTAATEGVGMYEQVAELEWFASEAAHGKVERIGVPSPTFKSDATSTQSYSFLYIQAEDKSANGVVSGAPGSLQEVYICLDKGVAGAGFGGQVAGSSTDIVDVLDAWVAGYSTGSAQTGNI